MILFLWGMMGTGKTHFLKILSTHFSITNIFDLDNLIEHKTNLTIQQLFSQGGEELFRRIERETLIELLEEKSNFILATGGGTPCFFDNAKLMRKKGVTIYLKTPIEILTQRLWNERHKRPLISNFTTQADLQNYLYKLLKKREKYYSQAHIIWDTTLPAEPLIECLGKLIEI